MNPQMYSVLFFVSLTTPARFTQPAYDRIGAWSQISSLSLFIDPFNKHWSLRPFLQSTCSARVGLGDETIRINAPVLAHREVDRDTEDSPCHVCHVCGASSVQRRKCFQLSFPFSQLRYMQGKHFSIIKPRARKILFWLVELGAIPSFGFKGTIFPINIFSSL